MKYFSCIFILLCSTLLLSVVSSHIPPERYNPVSEQEIRLEIISGWLDIARVDLIYRTEDTKYWDEAKMEMETPEGPYFRGFLPIPRFADKAYAYYFKLTLTNGSIEFLPKLEPEANAFLVQPLTKEGKLSEDFILLTDYNEVLVREGYILAVSWFALEDNIDVKSIKVYINGKDITKRATITNNMLFYRDNTPKPGKYSAYLTAVTLDGKKLYSQTWTTVMKAGGSYTKLPLNLRGNLNTGTNLYQSSLADSATAFGSDLDDSWLNMELFGEYKKLELQAYTYLSTLETDNKQAINRYRFGFNLPFWQTFLGDYSPDISTFTMNCKNLRGIYSKLYSENIGLAVAHGEMMRATQGVKSQTKDNYYWGSTFKQEAIAGRLQLGKDNGFRVGFNASRNRDIVSSLEPIYYRTIVIDPQTNQPDTTFTVYPHDNLVISIDSRLNIPNQNVMVGIEAAGSLYNKNILPGAITSDELNDYIDELPLEVDFRDFQDFYIFNINNEPLIPGIPNTAWQAYFRSFWYNNMMDFSYTEVNSAFKSLSTNYLQPDASRLQFVDQFNFRQYVFFTGGYYQNKDNLSKHRIETNITDSYLLQLMLRIPRLPYLATSFTNSDGKNKRNSSIAASPGMYNPYERNSKTISIGAGYNFTMIPVAPTMLDLGWRISYSEQTQLSTPNPLVVYDDETENISISITNSFIPVPLKTRISASMTDHEMKKDDKLNSNLNFLLYGEYRFWKNKIIPWLEFRTVTLSGDQDSQAYYTYTAGATAKPFSGTSASTSLSWRDYLNHNNQDKDYNTTTWRFIISQYF